MLVSSSISASIGTVAAFVAPRGRCRLLAEVRVTDSVLTFRTLAEFTTGLLLVTADAMLGVLLLGGSRLRGKSVLSGGSRRCTPS